jgi:beta-glucosidase-like glycosyl hydrolase
LTVCRGRAQDPVLGSQLVKPLVLGIQKHVMSISKHYIMNSQEFDRHSTNEVVDEVTAMELYGPPFGAAAAAGTSGFMCSCDCSPPPLPPWRLLSEPGR